MKKIYTIPSSESQLTIAVSGMGILPMNETITHGQDAHATRFTKIRLSPRVSVISLLLLTVLTTFSYAADPLKTLASIEEIEDFAFGGIGAAGITSKGELAFREILKRPSAEKDFLTLLNSGNAQARCYALVALHGISPKSYAGYAARFVDDKTEVSMIGGCMPARVPMNSIVRSIGTGTWDRYLKK